ncbi:4-oxalocrotonate tautomerase [Acinetobacter gyllenbergii]|uniref:4-oxalocrotonate tautomerase n=1 Tax=Acinetobacter gyllenbergii CIP 110306 = MTCC 11365 TaxID=1217657 RepID=A0A829HPF6_9GAMM|nr:4-oxalocrotonate tautomerase [Acinetobacter gyllenbergii]EPF93387.1 4-oxalocrotonate tautomerase [Acinetobacter gyllenbergii CIP 110306 = MTCC 11365]EPH32411.1 4-oxalocrotonate tautomerase [Acinetobacter gyllenbergii CIP 110306 = MTCC 11365]GMA11917.1 4-oxalocrotonate tautomerase [Acinetobacter gyllenbergii]
MPLITIELSPGRTHEQKKEFMEQVTKLTSEVLKCSVDTIDVVFKEVSGNHWAHAGRFYSEPDK